jgi:hypothetical protein
MRARFLFFFFLLGCGSSPATGSGRLPSNEVLLVGKTGGCGNVFVWRAGADSSRFLTVRIDAKNAGLAPGGSRRFDLAAQSNALVQLEVYPNPIEEPPYCTDIVHDETKPEIWRAEAGYLSVDLAPATPPDKRFHATVRVRDVRLRSPEGMHMFIATATIDDVIVGWNPG